MARGWAQGLSTSPLGLEMAIAPMIEHLRSIGCLDASREDIYTYAWFDDLQSAQATASDLKKIADVITTYLGVLKMTINNEKSTLWCVNHDPDDETILAQIPWPQSSHLVSLGFTIP
eukprot:4783643-Amphidinium_carterae.2